MWQNALNTILAAGLVALIGFLCAGIKAFGDVGIAYVQRKKDALIAKIGADTYNHDLAVARSVWGMVDEDARTNPELQKIIGDVTARIQAKQALFAEKIQKAIPGITDDEIEQLRQAVAGEVNKGREALIAPAVPTPQTAAQPERGAVASDTTGAV